MKRRTLLRLYRFVRSHKFDIARARYLKNRHKIEIEKNYFNGGVFYVAFGLLFISIWFFGYAVSALDNFLRSLASPITWIVLSLGGAWYVVHKIGRKKLNGN